MHKSAEYMIVPAVTIAETPKAFQDYVKKFFKSKTILGWKCFVAHGAHSMSNDSNRRKGVAPAHSVELSRFKEGLPEGTSLEDWMEKNEGKYIWRDHNSWDDGCIESIVGD